MLANRLTENRDTRVLLLEAGGWDRDPWIHIPLAWGKILTNRLHDWMYFTEPEANLGERRIECARGKVIGGSSSINAMTYSRGHRADYDRWAANGLPHWSYAHALPYFKKSEDFEDGASEYHGAGGPLSVRVCPDPNARSPQFMNAAAEIGYDGPDWDYNGARQEDGAGLLQFTVTRDGKRASAVQAFLTPVKGRPNLTIRSVSLHSQPPSSARTAADRLNHSPRQCSLASRCLTSASVYLVVQATSSSGRGLPVCSCRSRSAAGCWSHLPTLMAVPSVMA